MAFRQRTAFNDFSRRHWAGVRARVAGVVGRYWTRKVPARACAAVWVAFAALAVTTVGCFGSFFWHELRAKHLAGIPSGHVTHNRYPDGPVVHRNRYGPGEDRTETPLTAEQLALYEENRRIARRSAQQMAAAALPAALLFALGWRLADSVYGKRPRAGLDRPATDPILS